MTPPKGIAFFDFDNTIIHGDAGPLFGNFLVQERYERVRQEAGKKAANKDQAKLIGRYVPYLAWMGIQTGLYKARAVRRSQLVRSAYRALKGIPADDYYARLDDFVDEEIPDRIYPEVRKIIAKHQKDGVQCVIVTTGVEELVKRSVRHLPGEIVIIGCRLEEKDGVLTGKVDGPLYGADKANILRAYAAAAGVGLEDCWAYSDHYSDFHMLDAVGHPVCINPRSRLLRMAQERGWTIITPGDPRGP